MKHFTVICATCHKPKDIRHFYYNRSNPQNHGSHCKECLAKKRAAKKSEEFKQVFDIISKMDIEGKL